MTRAELVEKIKRQMFEAGCSEEGAISILGYVIDEVKLILSDYDLQYGWKNDDEHTYIDNLDEELADRLDALKKGDPT